jgi:hypothetical protein
MSAFETAVADSKKLTSKPSNDDLLELYGTLLSHTIYGALLTGIQDCTRLRQVRIFRRPRSPACSISRFVLLNNKHSER